MKKLLILPITCLLLSCGNESPKENKPTPVKTVKLTERETLIRKIRLNDTLTPGGYSIRYSLDSTNKLVITLGGKHFQRSFHGADFPQAGTYVYKNEWKNFIGLRNNCGSECWTLSLLPLTKKGTIKSYDYDIASDIKQELVFGKKRLDGNEYYIANIRTSKKKKIILNNLFGQGLPGNGIDSVAFVKDGLYVKWEVVSGKGKSKEEVFKFKI
jgi:hypothetical protein